MELPQSNTCNTCTKLARRNFPGESQPEDQLEALAGSQFGARKGVARSMYTERRGVPESPGIAGRASVW